MSRRKFLSDLAILGATSLSAGAQTAPGNTNVGEYRLPEYACAQDYRSLKQSSFDPTGGNNDSWKIEAGATREVFSAAGPGVITHIWFTIAADSRYHLKELVMRMYWDGQSKPSVEVPVGDFFGLNLGQYSIYQSAFLNCSPVHGLNSYFAMPFRKAARITISNEGAQAVDDFYSDIDYQLVSTLPERTLYFHAQYRQAIPNKPQNVGTAEGKVNLRGENNYVFLEAHGRGHLMGVTMGVLQNSDRWMGEGDDMIFIDDEPGPVIRGTGTEDYFCGAWNFGGLEAAVPFAHFYNGAHIISEAEQEGGRYCLYRWHADNPITFRKYLRHTIEHGHANGRADSFCSVAYWYQSEPYTEFPPLPGRAERIPALRTDQK